MASVQALYGVALLRDVPFEKYDTSPVASAQIAAMQEVQGAAAVDWPSTPGTLMEFPGQVVSELIREPVRRGPYMISRKITVGSGPGAVVKPAQESAGVVDADRFDLARFVVQAFRVSQDVFPRVAETVGRRVVGAELFLTGKLARELFQPRGGLNIGGCVFIDNRLFDGCR